MCARLCFLYNFRLLVCKTELHINYQKKKGSTEPDSKTLGSFFHWVTSGREKCSILFSLHQVKENWSPRCPLVVCLSHCGAPHLPGSFNTCYAPLAARASRVPIGWAGATASAPGRR